MDTVAGITALSELLKPQETTELENEEEICTPTTKAGITPGEIGPTRSTFGKRKEDQSTQSIWHEEDVLESLVSVNDDLDPRPQPEYEILFQQKVTSEDMFLQMSNKTPATASCEDLVIKISLPDTLYSQIDLQVTDFSLDCRTPKHKLGLYLPHHVDSKNGKAQWDKDTEILSVTLRMIRSYDFMK